MKKAGILLAALLCVTLSCCKKNHFMEELIGTNFIIPPDVTETETQSEPPEMETTRASVPPDEEETTAPAETTALSSLDFVSPPAANAAAPLDIRTYDGYNQPCHPKVLFFENGWNGYEYWMVYTPYPYCEDSLENPSIAVSHDGITWTTPAGLVNPVTGLPPTTENSAHYSDPHILMNGNKMELWFRYNPSYGDGVDADSNGAVILRTTSTDGIHWSMIETMRFSNKGNTDPVLSPVVMLDKGIYTMWYAKRDGKLYQTSTADGVAWTTPQETDLGVPGSFVWHQDMIKTDIGYEIVFCARPAGAKDNFSGLSLYYAASSDGLHFTNAVKIISPSESGFDSLSIYRASILKINGRYQIYYSAVNAAMVWKIGLVKGDAIPTLTGFGREGFPG